MGNNLLVNRYLGSLQIFSLWSLPTLCRQRMVECIHFSSVCTEEEIMTLYYDVEVKYISNLRAASE